MKVYFTDHFSLPLPPGHRFPIQKYARLRERVAASGLGELLEPMAVMDEQILLVHDQEYLRKILSGELTEREVRNLVFPWSSALIERSRRSSGATLAAGRMALTEGVAVNLAGGTHHAYPDRAEGFCVFNDAAIALRVLQREGRIRRGLVVDTDVHQGNGTAVIFADDPSVVTFSIHGFSNYPFRKERGDIDLALEDGAGDEVFLAALEQGLDLGFARGPFDLVLYLAGADPHENDRLGRLKVTKDGLARRDVMVFERCVAERVPVAVAMAGGYGRELEDTVDIHYSTVVAAAAFADRLSRRSGA